MSRSPRARRWRTVAIAGLAFLPAACAGYGERGDTPAWFKERSKQLRKDGPFPELAAVPLAPTPGRSFEQWEEIERELRVVGEAVETSPRARPASESPDAAALAAEAGTDTTR